MDDHGVAAALAGMRPMATRVYEALAGGARTDRELRDMLGSRGSGPRDAMAELLERGLTRHAGRAGTKGRPMRYERTPLADVEAQKEKNAARKPKKQRRGGTKLRDVRKMEDGGSTSAFYREWSWIKDAMSHVRANEVQMFWKSAPFDDIELLAPEVAELVQTAQDWLASFELRKAEEDTLRKIEKLSDTNGRTPEEIENAVRLKERMEGRLM